MKLFRSSVALLVSAFRWIIISDFGLSRFPRPRSLQTEEKWEESRKDGMILQNQRNSSDRRKSGIMLGLVLDDGKERQGQVYFTSWVAKLWCAKDSADLNIYFQRNLCGFGDTGHATNGDAFLFFQFRNETKNSGFLHVESGNRDTPKFVLKKSGWVAGLQSPWAPDPYWLGQWQYNETSWDRSHGLPDGPVWQHIKLLVVSSGTCPRNKLVANEDVKKPNNQTKQIQGWNINFMAREVTCEALVASSGFLSSLILWNRGNLREMPLWLSTCGNSNVNFKDKFTFVWINNVFLSYCSFFVIIEKSDNHDNYVVTYSK